MLYLKSFLLVMKRLFFNFISLMLVIPFQVAVAAGSDRTFEFSKEYAPEKVGNRIAYHFVGARHELYAGRYIHYGEVCAWSGALEYAEKTNDRKLIQLLVDRFEPFFGIEKPLLPPKNHVDYNMFGGLALQLYLITGEDKYKKMGLEYADSQWEIPENATPGEKYWAEKGYSWQTRLWIDDMFMITFVQTQAYKVTNDMKYLDRAASEMVLYLNTIQREDGLFYHAPDVPYYWGRGDGWMAVGMANILQYLPEHHKDRARIMEGYHTMMKSLLKYQRPDGMWNQLINEPDCWAETSGTAMFTYAFIVGIRQGWLDAEKYGPAVQKAWPEMVKYIDERNNVTEVCIGTGKKNDKQYYYDRPRLAGDFHGQAPYLWCATALM